VAQGAIGLGPEGSPGGSVAASTDGVKGMRGIVAFALMTALMAVVDAAFFKGRYLNDAESAITGLASLSMRIGHR
jgi:hypothetical protein